MVEASQPRGVVRGRDDVEGTSDAALVAFTHKSGLVASGNKCGGLVPDLPIVDLKTDQHLYAIVDTACNTSVAGWGWFRRAEKTWNRHGYQRVRVHDRTGPYGGLAGDATATMTGKVRWPMLMIAESNDPCR